MPDSVPIYRADGPLIDWADDQRLARLESFGLVARLVRRRDGAPARAYLHVRPGDPKPTSPAALLGTRYAVRERLSHGPQWDLRHLGSDRDVRTTKLATCRSVAAWRAQSRITHPCSNSLFLNLRRTPDFPLVDCRATHARTWAHCTPLEATPFTRAIPLANSGDSSPLVRRLGGQFPHGGDADVDKRPTRGRGPPGQRARQRQRPS